MGYPPHSAVGERDFPCLSGGKPAEYQDGGLDAALAFAPIQASMLSAICNVEMTHRSICLPDLPAVSRVRRYSRRDWRQIYRAPLLPIEVASAAFRESLWACRIRSIRAVAFVIVKHHGPF